MLQRRGRERRRLARRVVGVVITFVALVGLAACEPPPPRIRFTVDTTASGSDVQPGDGVCATAAGRCSLDAAFQEAAEAGPGVDITVPAGTYSVFAAVAGDVRVNWSGPVAAELIGSLTVLPGSRLAIDGISTRHPTALRNSWGLEIHAQGEAQVHRSMIRKLTVEPGGVAVLDRSIVVNGNTNNGEGEAAVVNHGLLLAVNAAILGYPGPGPVLDNADGTTHLRAAVLADLTVLVNGTPWASGDTGTCSGGPTTSYGLVHAEEPCASAAEGDSSGDAGITAELTAIPTTLQTSFELVVAPTSPLVDAVPLGHPACDTASADLFGTPRGIDGDGDGVGGCDIGAIERPATPT